MFRKMFGNKIAFLYSSSNHLVNIGEARAHSKRAQNSHLILILHLIFILLETLSQHLCMSTALIISFSHLNFLFFRKTSPLSRP